MLTIKQWQTPTQHTITTKYTEKNTAPCFNCKNVSKEAIEGVCHNLYDSETQICCIHCWDQESWECPHCNQTPSDEDCISCWKCGQWAHKNCKVVKTEATDDYVCNMCKHAGGIIDVLSFQKSACVTKLKVESNEFKEKTTQFNMEIAKVHRGHKEQVNLMETKHASRIKEINADLQRNNLIEKERIAADNSRLQRANDHNVILKNQNKQLTEKFKKGWQDVLEQQVRPKIKKLVDEKNTAMRSLTASESRNASANEEINLLKKKTKQLGEQIKTMDASLKARSETVNQMKKLTREKNNAMRLLTASNSRNESANQEIVSLTKQTKELRKQVTRLETDGKKNNKRKRACDQMLTDMHKMVRTYRARWNYTPPEILNDIDKRLWNLYGCKTDGSTFSADKIVVRHQGTPSLWYSLQNTMTAIRRHHIQITMQNK